MKSKKNEIQLFFIKKNVHLSFDITSTSFLSKSVLRIYFRSHFYIFFRIALKLKCHFMTSFIVCQRVYFQIKFFNNMFYFHHQIFFKDKSKKKKLLWRVQMIYLYNFNRLTLFNKNIKMMIFFLTFLGKKNKNLLRKMKF